MTILALPLLFYNVPYYHVHYTLLHLIPLFHTLMIFLPHYLFPLFTIYNHHKDLVDIRMAGPVLKVQTSATFARFFVIPRVGSECTWFLSINMTTLNKTHMKTPYREESLLLTNFPLLLSWISPWLLNIGWYLSYFSSIHNKTHQPTLLLKRCFHYVF